MIAEQDTQPETVGKLMRKRSSLIEQLTRTNMPDEEFERVLSIEGELSKRELVGLQKRADHYVTALREIHDRLSLGGIIQSYSLGTYLPSDEISELHSISEEFDLYDGEFNRRIHPVNKGLVLRTGRNVNIFNVNSGIPILTKLFAATTGVATTLALALPTLKQRVFFAGGTVVAASHLVCGLAYSTVRNPHLYVAERLEEKSKGLSDYLSGKL